MPFAHQRIQADGLLARHVHQRLHVIVRRIVDQIPRRAEPGDMALLQDGNPVREQHGFDHIMGDHDGGEIERVVQLAIIAAQGITGAQIQRAERVRPSRPHAWLGGNGARNTDALALAAGQFGRNAVSILLGRQLDQI